MHEYWQILGSVIPLFVIMGVGAAIRKFGILNEQADRTLTDLCVHVLLPCLILDHIMASESLRHSGNLVWGPFIGFVATAASIGIAWVVAILWRFPDKSQERTFGFIAGLYNYGYLPVPLIATLYGADALGALFLYNLGTELAFWIVGFALMTGHTIFNDWRRALTSPVRAILLGTAINVVTGHFGLRLDDATLEAHAWGWPVKIVTDTIHLIGLCSIPIALLLIGATMADFAGEFKVKSGGGVMALAIFVRNGIGPLALIAVALLPMLSVELKETLVVQAAMPAGVFPLVLARRYGGSLPVAIQVIFATSAAAIITLPLWIHFGMQMVGLK